MKKLICKFLDEYLGDEIKVETFLTPTYIMDKYAWRMKENYYIYSGTGILILYFCFNKEDEFNLFRGDELCETLGGYFGIEPIESMKYIREWFADKHNMEKVSDLKKFIK